MGFKMIDIDAEIIPFESIANILLDSNVSLYLDDMYANFDVEFKEYSIPFGETNVAYILDDIIRVSATPEGKIIAIGCSEKYKGKYKGKLYPGMTMGELISLTESQRILNGTIIVDEDYGLSFTLPSPYDEIADYIKYIPHDLELNEIYVSDYSFWKPKG